MIAGKSKYSQVMSSSFHTNTECVLQVCFVNKNNYEINIFETLIALNHKKRSALSLILCTWSRGYLDTHDESPVFPLPGMAARSQSKFKQKVAVSYFLLQSGAIPKIINKRNLNTALS